MQKTKLKITPIAVFQKNSKGSLQLYNEFLVQSGQNKITTGICLKLPSVSLKYIPLLIKFNLQKIKNFFLWNFIYLIFYLHIFNKLNFRFEKKKSPLPWSRNLHAAIPNNHFVKDGLSFMCNIILSQLKKHYHINFKVKIYILVNEKKIVRHINL